MKEKFCKDLKAGEELNDTFLVKEFVTATTKNNKPYARFKLQDKTGTINAVMWGWKPEMGEIPAGAVFAVQGQVSEYNGVLQVSVVTYVPAIGAEMHHYEVCTKYNVEELSKKLDQFISCFEHPWFKQVAEHLLVANNEFRERFEVGPAATGVHHAFKSGLLEHTVEMLESGEALLSLPFYKRQLNRDLCMFGIMFHDFGKIFEYSPDAGFKKTLQGVLVPHIPMTAALIYEAANIYKVPEIIRDFMMHVVLSHHRMLEWGSPVKFACQEAAFVHYVDCMHGEVMGMAQGLENAKPGDVLYKQPTGDRLSLSAEKFTDILLRCDKAVQGS